MKRKVNIEELFEKYLKDAKLDKSKMPPVQIRETKRAFFNGCAALLHTLMDAVSGLSDEDGAETLENIDKQIRQFWILQNIEQSRRNN